MSQFLLQNRYYLFTILLFCSLSLFGQQPQFIASTDAKEVVPDGIFNVTFTLMNAKGNNFQPPKFENLKVVSGPSQSSQMQIINGKVSQKMSYTYALLAEKQGNYQIGSASINIAGKVFKSQPVNVKVVKGKAKSATDKGEELFVRLELSDSTVYVGQQITLKYMLYTNTDVHSADFLTESEYDGFFATRIRNYRERSEQVVLEGKQYTKKSLKTIALFPQQTGNFDIDGAIVNLGLPIENGRSGFFFSTRVKPVRVKVEPVTIKVLAPPANAPISYSGAVGKFKMWTATVDKKSVTTDDAFTVVMEIRGDGDANFIQAPTQPNSAKFDFFEPNVIKDETIENNDGIVVLKEFEYLVTAKEAGKHFIKPEFTYLDIDSNQYVTLYAKPIRISVAQGSDQAEAKRLRQEQEAELQPIITSTKLSQKKRSFLYSIPYWGLFSMPLLGFVFVFFEKKKKDKIAGIDPKLKKQAEAKSEALKRLETVKVKMDQRDSRGFYDELYKSVNRLLLDKYMIPGSELNLTKVEERLGEQEIQSEHKTEIIDILNQCQRGLFARTDATTLNLLYDKSVDLISAL